MMRLKVPNGIINSNQLRFYADSVEKYGYNQGVIDITTRANIQLRGVKIEDAPDIIEGLHARNQTSFQSALDSVRNMVGNPLAGIDECEMVDTRELCNALNDLVSLDPVTNTRGNPMWGNLPRKFNIAISGSRDDFAHTHINDIGLQPCPHAETGEMGFNVVLGGYMSIKVSFTIAVFDHISIVLNIIFIARCRIDSFWNVDSSRPQLSSYSCRGYLTYFP